MEVATWTTELASSKGLGLYLVVIRVYWRVVGCMFVYFGLVSVQRQLSARDLATSLDDS